MAGYGKQLTDEDFLEAQRNDRLSHDMEGVGDAISSAFMRKPVAPQKDYSQADALEQRGQMQDKEAARARAADDDDPSSPASRAMQATFSKLHPEAAEYAPGLSFRKILAMAPHMRQYADKPLAPPPLLSIKEVDPQTKEKTAAEIELLKARAEAANRPHDGRATNPLDDELKRAKLAKLTAPPTEKPLSVRDQAIKERLKRQKEQADVPGFEDSDPDHPHMLSQSDAAELRKSATARDNVLKNVGLLRKLYAANPHALPTSSAMAQMKALIAETQGSISSLNDQQLTQGHQHLNDAMMSDPATAQAYLNSGVLPTQLDQLEHTARMLVENRAARMQRREAGHSGGAAAGGTIQMRFPDGSVHPVSADKVEMAKTRKGAVPVDG